MSRRTNGVATRFANQYGAGMVEVTADMLDIGRRLQEGDELWRGDPTMTLCFNELTDKFEVIAHDAKGNPYIAHVADVCDERILIALTESDWQRGTKAMIDRLVKQTAAANAEQDREVRDRQGEIAEKVAWGIRRAFATHLGGRKIHYSMNTPGRK